MLAVVITVIKETAVSLVVSVMAVMAVFTETAVSPVFSMISVSYVSIFSGNSDAMVLVHPKIDKHHGIVFH